MDIELLKRAKSYIDDMSNGINPITKAKVSKDDLINNPRISKCLFYVSCVLNDYLVKEARKVPKPKFYLTEDEKKRFTYNGDLIVSSLARKISDLKTNEDMRNLKCTRITNWLLSLGYLKIVEQDGKNRKLPTQMGKNLGLYSQIRDGYKGRYEIVLYNKNAQVFIMDNLDKIISFANKDEEML